jgi:hypothetical protein
VGDLVEEDGDGGGSSNSRRGVETGRHGQTISDVVSKVSAVYVSLGHTIANSRDQLT